MRTLRALFIAASLVPTVGCAQVTAAPTASAPAVKRPTDQAAYDLHHGRAKAAAEGVAKNILPLCELGPVTWGTPAPPTKFQPGRAFDALYYVGLYNISAWAIKTSDGIILIDALRNAKDAEETIVPNMRQLGLDPAQIKYLVITHGHADHYGGAPYIVDHFHPRVVASDADWKVMEAQANQPNTAPPPKRDMVVADGHKLTLGGATITLYLTPGHTPGTISLVMPVKDNGQSHVAVLWGGTAFPRNAVASDFRVYAESAERFGAIAAKAKADVVLSNHGYYDDTPLKLPALAARKPGDPNPFVTGSKSVRDFMIVASECARARQAAF